MGNAAEIDASIDGQFARDLDFTTENIALFAENQFKVSEKFSVTPGIRYEYIKNTSLIHSEYELIQKGNPASVLPTKIITKLCDSLAGKVYVEELDKSLRKSFSLVSSIIYLQQP